MRHLMGVAVLGLAVLVGCRGSTLPPAAQRDPVLRENYPRVTVLDGLQPWIAVTEPIVSREEGRPLRVSVPVRAVTQHEDLNVQYRFQFLDDQGRPVDPDPTWRYERLPSKAQRILDGSALDQRAVDWRFEIRPAR